MSEPKSGLRTFKREFSSDTDVFSWGSQTNSQRSTLNEIKNLNVTSAPSTQAPPRSKGAADAEQRAARMNAIMAALSAKATDEKPTSKLKRSEPPTDNQPGPAKKKRVLPWDAPSTSTSPSSSKPDSSGTATKSKGSGLPGKIFLSAEQKHILNLVQKGQSVFYTGSAGTGKSVLLREIIKSLRAKYKNPANVAITASTGIAACNIGGVTIHSFAGIGLGLETPEKLATKVKKNPKALQRWRLAKVLIIDEGTGNSSSVSMALVLIVLLSVHGRWRPLR